MKRHRRTHTGQKPFERPFKCNLRDQISRQQPHLKSHERIHHEQPKLKCTWTGCTAEFNAYQNIIQHIKAHHDPTPYHYDQCDRKYKLKRDLDHKRKHQIMKTRKLQQNDTRWYNFERLLRIGQFPLHVGSPLTD